VFGGCSVEPEFCLLDFEIGLSMLVDTIRLEGLILLLAFFAKEVT
jgi:hypothetical protein